MPQAGMLLQTDGSHHPWLEERGPRFVLLLAVDDATGIVANAVFRPMSRAFAKRTTAAEESCTTGVMIEGRMAGGVGTVWERERTVQG